MFNPFSKNNGAIINYFSDGDLNIFYNSGFFESDQLLFTHNEPNFESQIQTKFGGKANSFLNLFNNENITVSYHNMDKSDSKTKSKSNLQVVIDNSLPGPYYENEIIGIIRNKMDISGKIKNILDSYSDKQNDKIIENVKKALMKK